MLSTGLGDGTTRIGTAMQQRLQRVCKIDSTYIFRHKSYYSTHVFCSISLKTFPKLRTITPAVKLDSYKALEFLLIRFRKSPFRIKTSSFSAMISGSGSVSKNPFSASCTLWAIAPRSVLIIGSPAARASTKLHG